MENQPVGELVSKRFTWTIENFSKLKTQKHYSEVFLVGDWKWRLLIFPKGNNVKQLSVYLDAVDASHLPFLWTRYAQFSLTVVNQLNRNMSIWKETQHEFYSTESDWGFTSFMPLTELCDSSKGFLWNDKCILEAEVKVRKVSIKSLQATGSFASTEPSEQEDEEKEASSVDSIEVPPSSEQVLALQESPSSERAPSNVESVQVSCFSRPHMVFSSEQVGIEPTDSPVGKLIDFKGLANVEKAFVPLLEEVCSWHPALIECQKKRSAKFIGWAFTALGRVLHFLKTTNAKEMTEDACQQLQLLWEELETFNFDLAWLEPHVELALNVKKLVERAGVVKELTEDVDALEIDVKKLRARVAVAEVDLEVAKRELAKAEEGFGGTEMNKELGYGSHKHCCRNLSLI